jgi:hypothetical protein
MTAEELRRLAAEASDRYRAMPASQRLRHDYMQRKSFAKGMASDASDYEKHCHRVDERMPDPDGLTDAQIGLILINSPWHLLTDN